MSLQVGPDDPLAGTKASQALVEVATVSCTPVDLLADLAAQAQQGGPTLTLVQGQPLGRMWAVPAGVSVVGRSSSAGVRVTDPSISSAHAEVEPLAAGLRVKDLGSRNGTFVAHERVTESVVADGQAFQVGSAVLMYHAQGSLDALHVSRLYEQATRDELTRAMARRMLEPTAEAARLRALGCRMMWALLVMDLDAFRPINDQAGHNVGDAVLREFARRAQACLPPGEELIRLGGDEFAAVLSPTLPEHACHLAERIREALASESIQLDDRAILVTVSVGVAAAMGQVTLAAMLERADDALRQAKSRGMDTVCLI